MGQTEVLEALAKKGWLTKSQIAEYLNDCNLASINQSLRRLIKGGFVEFKKCEYLKHGYLYRIKDEPESENNTE